MMAKTRLIGIGHSAAPLARVAACLCALGFALLAAGSAEAALREYRVQFQPSPSPTAAGYVLHIGDESGEYSIFFDLGSPPSSGGTIVYAVDLEDSIDLFVALSAYDSSGTASPLSNELRVSAVDPPPITSGISSGSSGGSDDGSGSGSGDMGGSSGSGTSGGSSSDSGGSTGGNDLGSGTLSFVPSNAELGISAAAGGQVEAVLGDGSLSMLTLDSLAAGRDVRPVRCDLDGDGDQDLVMGFGKKSGAQVAIVHMQDGAVVAMETLEAGTPEYRKRKASHTTPACGDLDGDGRAEIVIGFGKSMQGRVQVFDDETTGFQPLPSAQTDAEGFMQIPVPERSKVATLPAVGDIDGDGLDELVVGFGRSKDPRVVFLEDARADFEIHGANRTGEPWLQIRPAPEQAKKKGKHLTAPALGDYDGDGVDEIAIAFGRGSRGRVAILDDVRAGLPVDDSQVLRLAAGRDAYRKKNGETRVSFGDVDGDGAEELIVSFTGKGSHELQVFDDISSSLARPLAESSGFVSSDDPKARWFAAGNR